MSDSLKHFEAEGGVFVTPPSLFAARAANIKAVLFDWDGVFNEGFKQGTEGSNFSEVSAMGTNLLRFALWKRNGVVPVSAIMTGETNPPAVQLARREHFHVVYQQSKNKAVVFDAMLKQFGLKAEEVAFFFDDVLDLAVARRCGVRIMVARSASPMLRLLAREEGYADYLTANDGGTHAVREGCELLMESLGLARVVMQQRSVFSADYQQYLQERQGIETSVLEGGLS